jgi:hypothetical protein
MLCFVYHRVVSRLVQMNYNGIGRPVSLAEKFLMT